MTAAAIAPARFWNTWESDHPAAMRFLPLGLEIRPCAYAASRNAFTYLLHNLRDKKELFYSLPKRSPELIELTQNLSVEKFTHQTNLALLEQHRDEIVVEDLEKALVILEISILANIRKYIMGEHVAMTDEEFVDSLSRLSTAFLKYEGPL